MAAVVLPDGETRQVAGDLWFPNGMAVTPDGSALIVAESYASRLTAFTLTADGSLTERGIWAELDEGAAPNGICLDADGAVWYADVPNQHCRRVAEDGRVLDTVDVDRGCFACMLGGPDGQTCTSSPPTGNAWTGSKAAAAHRTGPRHDAAAPHAGRP